MQVGRVPLQRALRIWYIPKTRTIHDTHCNRLTMSNLYSSSFLFRSVSKGLRLQKNILHHLNVENICNGLGHVQRTGISLQYESIVVTVAVHILNIITSRYCIYEFPAMCSPLEWRSFRTSGVVHTRRVDGLLGAPVSEPWHTRVDTKTAWA